MLGSKNDIFNTPLLFRSFHKHVRIKFVRMELIFQLSVIFLVNVEIVLDPLCDTVCLGDLAGLRIFPLSCKDGIKSPMDE